MEQPAGGRPAVAAGVFGALWALALASVALVLATGAPFDDVAWYADRGFYAFYVMVALTSGAAAAVILARSDHAAGWIVAAIGLGFAASTAALGWAFLAGEHPALPGVGLAAHASAWLSAPGGFLAVTVLPWFLRPTAPRGIPLALAGLGATASVTIALTGAVSQQPGAPANPLSLEGSPLGTALGSLVWPSLWACAAVGLLAAGDVVRRWRREPPDGARAFGVLALGVVLLFVAMTVLQFWPPGAVRDTLQPLGLPLLLCAQVLLSLSVVVVALRTWDRGVGGVVPRAAVWGLLSSVVVALYVALFSAVSRALPMSDEGARTVVVAVLALLIHPLRQWLQDRVDVLVHGGAADPVRLLAQLGRYLHGGGHDAAFPALVEGLRDGLRLGWLEVVSTEQPQVRAAAGHLRATAAPDRWASYPLVVEGRHVGDLRVQAAPGQRLDERVASALSHLSHVVALSLDLTQTNLRLRATSARVGEVRLEERRMLRRELHDGLGPALAGVGLGLAAAQRRMLRDPDGAAHLLEDLRGEVGRRTEDLRLLARSLLPAQLDDGDLPEALDVLAERFRSSGLQVTTDVDAGDLATPQQIAVYHVAAEALLNAHRHARAGRVAIVVQAPADGGAVLDVTDDGRGLPDERRAGIGLTTMRERARELGGEVSVETAAGGGTRVRMVLP